MDLPGTGASNAISPDSYAFLNHSTDTVHHNLPPDVDDKHLARQKRKRTSPEDAAILESAYQRDPKPDKAARLQLVGQVALDEKGVQIWFQNRRQTSRRKSRPLLPHEIAQYQMSRIGVTQSALESRPGSDGLDDSAIDLSHDAQALPCSGDDDQDHGEDCNGGERCGSVSPDDLKHPLYPLAQIGQPEATALPSALQSTNVRPSATPGPSGSHEMPIGHLANRRRALLLDQIAPEQPSQPLPMSIITSKQKLKKSSSIVRLSMNAAGKAEIVTKDASSPSPPRPQPTIYPDLNNYAGMPVPTPRTLQKSASGRSRDSRSWEFWCDKESRSQLEYAAEKDASGSAAGAIGLLRTASGRNVLSSLPYKRNAPLLQRYSSAKRSKLEHRHGPLRRTNTSAGRLQGDGSQRNRIKPSEPAKSFMKGSDSDKENWSPDRDTSPASQHHANIEPGRADIDRIISRQNHGKNRSQRGDLSLQDDPENDDELATFMSTDNRKSGSTSGDDLDCVQGLLSLSQGNWR